MTSTGSISVSGLLGGTAGSIDTTSLITKLMTAQALPQTQLKDQLTTVQSELTAYQNVNTKVAAVQAAAQALTDPTAWQATTATSSSTAVVATSSSSATAGSTTFNVTQLARAQVSTIPADSGGMVITSTPAGITVTDGSGASHAIAVSSGSATAVAAAINAANVGVRASVLTTEQGTVLQLSSTKTGAANSFTVSGTDSPATNVVAAQDAKVTVGDPASGGYSVASSSNTFTGLIPGVTFSANALATDVSISVTSDEQSMSDKVKALVTAVNAAQTEISTDSAAGAVLQSKYDVRSISGALSSAVSAGVSGGGSLATYGIDMDKFGVLSFDATKFASAYAADPSGTQTAVAGSFATNLANTSTAAVAPVTGSLTAAIASEQTRSTSLNDEITAWTTRLASIQDNLTTKYNAMETALAKLQSQQTYLTSMFDSINGTSSSSSSSSS